MVKGGIYAEIAMSHTLFFGEMLLAVYTRFFKTHENILSVSEKGVPACQEHSLDMGEMCIIVKHRVWMHHWESSPGLYRINKLYVVVLNLCLRVG